jgi:hypothetical protein
VTSIPIAPVYLSLDDLCLHLACHYCWAWHHHGTGGTVIDLEHRAAHCWVTASPYHDKGYRLMIVGIWKPQMAKTRPWAKQTVKKPKRTAQR